MLSAVVIEYLAIAIENLCRPMTGKPYSCHLLTDSQHVQEHVYQLISFYHCRRQYKGSHRKVYHCNHGLICGYWHGIAAKKRKNPGDSRNDQNTDDCCLSRHIKYSKEYIQADQKAVSEMQLSNGLAVGALLKNTIFSRRGGSRIQVAGF